MAHTRKISDMFFMLYLFVLGAVVIPVAMLGLMGTVARFFLLTYLLIPVAHLIAIIYFWQRQGFKPLSIGLIVSLVIIIFVFYKAFTAPVFQ